MWCTRWFLPLLLLPLPTATPFFLLLFLFTLTMHAKPCFYCIILLATLFVSSCYWQPMSLDTPLSRPWSENITTFAEALKSTLSPSYTNPLPSSIHPIDRCWCDVSTSGFFEPFNTTHWEVLSVQRLKDHLERQQKVEEAKEAEKQAAASNSTDSILSMLGASDTPDTLDLPTTSTAASVTPTASAHSRSHTVAKAAKLWSLLRSRNLPPRQSHSADEQKNATMTSNTILRSAASPLPLFRREYDLRPYGVGVFLDFGFTPST